MPNKQPVRRAPSNRQSTQRRRKKRKQNNNLIYLAAVLAFIFLGLFGFLILEISGCSEQEESSNSDASEITSSTEESKAESKDESKEEYSKPVDTSKPEESDSSSDDVSEPESKPIVHESTKKYEEKVGVKYAIDMSEYEKFVCPDNEKEFVFIVNPNHPLSADYKPKNLVWCTSIRKGATKDWSYMDATANEALEAFLKEAAYYGYDDISVTNAYRSYSWQDYLFNKYVNEDIQQDYYCDTCQSYFDISYFPKKVTTVTYCNGCGFEMENTDGTLYCEICMMDVTSPDVKTVCAECKTVVRRPTKDETTAHVLTYSTRPGTSEHQSGLCCDMHNLPTSTSAFDNTPEAKWLAANAHRFGFILRYPPNTQHITGIKHESWHFRYVGRTAATEMYEKGLTLEEYLGDYPAE